MENLKPFYYYYDLRAKNIVLRRCFIHLKEAIEHALTEQLQPIDIYNSDGILIHSLPIHNFHF